VRNRWLQIPLFHYPRNGKHKKPSWLELFYDLVFVAAFIQLGNALSTSVSVEGYVGFTLVFIPLWLIWTGQTYFINRFTIDDIPHRLIVFVQMFAIGAMAVSAPKILDGPAHYFSISAAVAFSVVALANLRAFMQVEVARDYSRYWGAVFAVAAVLWFLSVFFEEPYTYVLWGIGVAFVIAAPFSRQSREQYQRYPMDREHIAERYGILTIIVLGESFVKVLGNLSHQPLELSIILQASFSLLITCSIWWLYFDDIVGTELKKQRLAPLVWLYSHLPLHVAITATGVAVYKFCNIDLSLVAPAKYRWLLSVSLALILFSVSALDSVSERKHQELSDRVRVNLRFFAGVFMLLLVPAGSLVAAQWYLLAITIIMVSLVAFDMIMAPFEQEAIDQLKGSSFSDLASSMEKRKEVAEGNRKDLSEASIKGAPNELRHDLYSFFIDGSWKRLFITAGFVYILINFVFACLFVIEPGSINSNTGNSFLDAFFFSVQTFSTIGYGAITPETMYGNILVTVEAALGLILVALVTGVMFAKASKPKSSVLFTENILLGKRNGKPTLFMRLGNARGSEIVDATLTMTAVMDDISDEGHHMRRLFDMKLVRNRTPLFRLSWSVMHEIDKDSPLHGIDLASMENSVWAIICTVVGHDGVYGQTVYARKIYYPESFVTGVKFADILSQMPDGRIIVDFDQFNKTLPVET